MTDKNREFHELVGKCWHEATKDNELKCVCGNQYILWNYLQTHIKKMDNPDYAADPRLVIEAMDEKKGRLEWFLYHLSKGQFMTWISIYLIMDKTGKLRDLGLEWFRREK